MKILKNNKGFVPGFFIVAASLIGLAVVWHIPAWTQAKKAHCEAAYQAGDMGCGYAINK